MIFFNWCIKDLKDNVAISVSVVSVIISITVSEPIQYIVTCSYRKFTSQFDDLKIRFHINSPLNTPF